MSSSASDTHTPHDVFISFRGEDTRKTFTSHLHDAFRDKGIDTYIDYRLDRGDDVWKALCEAINKSHISVVVFSEDYAGSKWCLKELEEIRKCRRNQGQVVIPVFYQMNPSHVRNPEQEGGVYREAFAKYEQDLLKPKKPKDLDQQSVSNWKAALKETGNISGWDSRNYENEAQVIRNIVEDVLQKLYLRYPNEIQGLVGINENRESIESLLERGVQAIGIWGMGGIGKSTLARVIFAKLFPQYDGICFLEKIREESERHGLPYLRDKLLSDVLKDEKPKSYAAGSSFDMRRLHAKKVLIVLDDVENFEQFEYLCGDYRYLRPDSRLIITTRNREFLPESVRIYQILTMGDKNSRKLFCLHAFKESQSQNGYENLIERALSYARGLPLALKVLGRHLRLKHCDFWSSVLSKLDSYPNKEIQNVLEMSYKGLEKIHQKIFLDIAFFFKDEDKYYVSRILNACDFFATSGIDTLEDKGLITISKNNRIQMHDLLQKMGLDIVRDEYECDPGRRSRLRNSEEVSAILQNASGTNMIEGISLDLSERDLFLSAVAFKVMPNLRIVKFYIPSAKRSRNVNFHGDLQSFSGKLRYLEWNGCPWKSLPQGFCAELLVEVHMPHSHVRKLWQGVQHLENLVGINLRECKQLVMLPNLSMAPKLEWIYLSGCETLRILHPSILYLDRLVTLTLDRCTNLKRLKSEKHSRSLKNINVNGCTSLKEFSMSSDLIKRLDLSNTGIQLLGPSIGLLRNLLWLNLEGLRLDHLPNELSCLASLKELYLSNTDTVIDKEKLHALFDGIRSVEILHLINCSNLSELPDNIGVLSSLHELRLDGSNVGNLPASIKHLQALEVLSLANCRMLWCILELPPSIKEFNAINCTSLITVSTLKTFAESMKGQPKHISFMNCSKLDGRSLQNMMEDAQLTMMSAAFHNEIAEIYVSTVHSYNYSGVQVCLPGSRVLGSGQFTYQNMGSSISIESPASSNLLGLIFSVVLSPCSGIKEHDAQIKIWCVRSNEDGFTTRNKFERVYHYKATMGLNSDHVFTCYDPYFVGRLKCSGQRFHFEFYAEIETENSDSLIIAMKECGVRFICKSEFNNFLRDMDLEFQRKVELGVKLELALDWEERGLLVALEKGRELQPEQVSLLESRRRKLTKTLRTLEKEKRKLFFPPFYTGLWRNRTQGLKDIVSL